MIVCLGWPWGTESAMISTAIPHCGQLNTATSALDTLTLLGHSKSMKVTLLEDGSSVNNWLAHMSSSKVKLRMGTESSKITPNDIIPSQTELPPLKRLFEQFPTRDEPFTDAISNQLTE
jgi:hypothetical protein